jgi:Rrf2 family protein
MWRITMPTSSRFAVAVHILTSLTIHEGEAVPSEVIAKSASTNPAVIRRILSMLNAAGFARSQLGQGGGALLARPAGSITLLDVYSAVESDALFALHRTLPDPGCVVGRHIQPVLQATMDKAIAAMRAELGKVTVADVARGIARRDRKVQA